MMLPRVGFVRTDVLEVYAASIFRVERINQLGVTANALPRSLALSTLKIEETLSP